MTSNIELRLYTIEKRDNDAPVLYSFQIDNRVWRSWPEDIQEFLICNSRGSLTRQYTEIEGLIEANYIELHIRLAAHYQMLYEYLGRS